LLVSTAPTEGTGKQLTEGKGRKMISGEMTYYAVNVALVVGGIIAIALARRRITDSQTRKLMTVALSLMVLAGILMSICQKIYRWAPSAYTADQMGITEGLHGKIMIFRHLSSLGYMLEIVAIAIFVILAKKLVSNLSADDAKISGDTAEEVQ
jgi:type III secretory pathway component EscS